MNRVFTFSLFFASMNLQISSLLLQHSPDDVIEPRHIRRILEDLQNTRASKIRKQLRRDLQGRTNTYKLGYLTSLEIDANRAVVARIMTDMHRLGVGAYEPSAGTTLEVSEEPSESRRPGRQLRRIQRNQ